MATAKTDAELLRRAFALAESGQFRCLISLLAALRDEGFCIAALSGDYLRAQLSQVIETAKTRDFVLVLD
jgi:hypothetical protein